MSTPSFELVAHDQQQVELRHTLPLSSFDRRRPTTLDLYFFIPRNVGVNALNYPRDDFYADLTCFMRLDLVAMSLEALGNDRAGSSPLVALRRSVDRLSVGDWHDPFASVSIKLFGHLFTQSVRTEFAALSTRLHDVVTLPSDDRWRVL